MQTSEICSVSNTGFGWCYVQAAKTEGSEGSWCPGCNAQNLNRVEPVSTLTAVKQFEEIAIIALTGISAIFCECMHLFLDLLRSVYCF